MERAGLEPKEEWRVKGPRDRHSGFDAVKSFLAIRPRPTAVVCFSDLVALGFMYGLARHRVRIGVDVAVTGYDDIDEAAIAMPPLTTVANGQSEVGRRAAGDLLNRLAGRPPSDETVLIKPQLRIRRSTGACEDTASRAGHGVPAR